MMRAVWHGTVIAEAPRTRVVEGNHYFPPDSLHEEYLSNSSMRTLCPWKGVARYFNITVDGATNRHAAWYYPHPSPLARRIKNHVAFRYDVTVEGTQEPKA